MQDARLTNALTGQPVRPSPLSVEITDAQERAQACANEVAGRLAELRDRLFGSSPETSSNGVLQKDFEAGCFRDSHVHRADMLMHTLNRIDTLSAEIANRI
jgi:hypothetical protein